MHPELERAAALDAQGRHGEAIDALARGTKAGDTECKAWLGLRLMAGDHAPALPAEGLGFLTEAAGEGSAFAAGRAAALLALGLHAPPDWPGVMHWLGKAATLGSLPAQLQIVALGGSPAAKIARGEAIPWEQMASTIDLGTWSQAPAAVTHSKSPRVCTFPDLINGPACEALISFARGRLQRALADDAAARRDAGHASRSNSVAIFGFDAIEPLHILLQHRMSAACGMSVSHFEAPTLLHYDVGERMENHFDFIDAATTSDPAGEIGLDGQRFATFMVYLNDGYEGGETAFPRLDIRHRGARGEGILFVNALADMSPDVRTLHAGCEVTRGEKWILTQFIRSIPTRPAP